MRQRRFTDMQRAQWGLLLAFVITLVATWGLVGAGLYALGRAVT